MIGNSINVSRNTFNACMWGAAAKRVPSGVVMTGNVGNNTPQLLVLSGLTGTDGAGCSINNNVGYNAWQVVRLDNMSGVSAHDNLSYYHGCTLADGSTPTLVFADHNCVVRMQGMTLSAANGNKLLSISPHAVTAAWPIVAVKMGEGPSIGPSSDPTTYCDVYDNIAFAGANVVVEEAGETENNTFWGNTGPASMTTLVSVQGTGSVDVDALTEWDSSTSTVTGTTVTTDLKAATVKGQKFSRSGDRIELEAAGQYTGASGTKQIFLVIGGTTVTFAVSSSGVTGSWSLRASLVFTGGSVRYIASHIAAGVVQVLAGGATVTASADWTVTVRGDLSSGTDSITCTHFWAK
jgi:hypothetical protein